MFEFFNISIVTYTNSIDDLKACLDSLEKQDVHKEVVLIDNLGAKLVEQLSSEYEFVQYFRCSNLGFGAGHNFAKDKFNQSGYRVYLNPDICLVDHCLSDISICFKKNSDVSLLSPKLLNLDGTLQEFVREYPSLGNMVRRIFSKTDGKCRYSLEDMGFHNAQFMHGAFFVINKDISNDLSLYDESYFLYLEDIDLCIKMSSYGKTGVCLDAKAFHRHEKASRKISRLTFIHIKSFVTFWMKHGLLYQKEKKK